MHHLLCGRCTHSKDGECEVKVCAVVRCHLRGMGRKVPWHPGRVTLTPLYEEQADGQN